MKKYSLSLTEEQLELLGAAVSFLATHIDQAEDDLDLSISVTEVDELENLVYDQFKKG